MATGIELAEQRRKANAWIEAQGPGFIQAEDTPHYCDGIGLEAVKEEAAGGWHVVALTHEGETDARLDCAQCSKVIAEGANEV